MLLVGADVVDVVLSACSCVGSVPACSHPVVTEVMDPLARPRPPSSSHDRPQTALRPPSDRPQTTLRPPSDRLSSSRPRVPLWDVEMFDSKERLASFVCHLALALTLFRIPRDSSLKTRADPNPNPNHTPTPTTNPNPQPHSLLMTVALTAILGVGHSLFRHVTMG